MKYPTLSSYDMKKLANLPELPRLAKLPKLPTINNPIKSYTPTPYTPYKSNYTESDVMFNSQDPSEVNSFADVAYRFLRDVTNGSDDKGVINNISDAIDSTVGVVKDVWKPLTTKIHEEGIKGLTDGAAWGAVGINNLIQIGETIDIHVNPLKGGLLEDGKFWSGWSSEGFKKGSVGDEEGRHTYDFDTGNWGLDLLGEIVVDPLNWITLGGALAGKGAITSGVNVGTDLAKELGQSNTKKMLKIYAKAFDGNVDDAVKQVMKQRFIKELTPEASAQLQKILINNTNLTIAKTIHGVRKAGDFLDRNILQLSLGYTPRLIKNVGKGGLRLVDNAIYRSVTAGKIPKEKVTLYNMVSEFKSLKKEIDSWTAIPELSNVGLKDKLILRSQAIKDLSRIQEIFVDNAGDFKKLKESLEAFAIDSGMQDFGHYIGLIRKLDEASNLNKVTILRRQLDDIDDMFNNVNEEVKEAIAYKLKLRQLNDTTEEAVKPLIDNPEISTYGQGQKIIKDLKDAKNLGDREIRDLLYKKYVEGTHRLTHIQLNDMMITFRTAMNELITASGKVFEAGLRGGKINPKYFSAIFDKFMKEMYAFDYGLDPNTVDDVLEVFLKVLDPLEESIDALTKYVPALKTRDAFVESIKNIADTLNNKIYDDVPGVVEFRKTITGTPDKLYYELPAEYTGDVLVELDEGGGLVYELRSIHASDNVGDKELLEYMRQSYIRLMNQADDFMGNFKTENLKKLADQATDLESSKNILDVTEKLRLKFNSKIEDTLENPKIKSLINDLIIFSEADETTTVLKESILKNGNIKELFSELQGYETYEKLDLLKNTFINTLDVKIDNIIKTVDPTKKAVAINTLVDDAEDLLNRLKNYMANNSSEGRIKLKNRKEFTDLFSMSNIPPMSVEYKKALNSNSVLDFIKKSLDFDKEQVDKFHAMTKIYYDEAIVKFQKEMTPLAEQIKAAKLRLYTEGAREKYKGAHAPIKNIVDPHFGEFMGSAKPSVGPVIKETAPTPEKFASLYKETDDPIILKAIDELDAHYKKIYAEKMEVLNQDLNDHVLKRLQDDGMTTETLKHNTVTTDVAGIVDDSNVVDIISTLEDVVDSLRTNFKSEAALIAAREEKIYQLKLATLQSTLLMYDIPKLNDLMKQGSTFEREVKFIIDDPNIPPEAKHAFAGVVVRMSDITATKELYDKILYNPELNDKLKMSIYDSLQNLYNFDFSATLNNPQSAVDKLLDNVDINVRDKAGLDSLSLDKIVDRDKASKNEIAEYINKKYPDIKSTSHTADYDTAVVEYLLDKHKLRPKNGTVISLDIETTGFKVSESEKVLQIAWTLPDGTMKQHTIAPPVGQYPPESVMYKLLGRPKGLAKNQSLKPMFDEVFRNSKNNISEAEALREFFLDIAKMQKLHGATDPVYLAGHNLNGFDLDFLKARGHTMSLGETSILSYGDRIKVLDTYEELLTKNNYPRMSKEEKEIVKDLLKKHIENLNTSPVGGMYQTLAIEGKLPDIVRKRQIVSSPNGDLARELDEVSEALMDDASGKAKKFIDPDTVKGNTVGGMNADKQSIYNQTSEVLRDISREVYNSLNNIGVSNKVFNLNYIKFSDIDPLGMSINQVLYSAIKELKDPNKMQDLAGKILVDWDLVLDFYKVEGEVFNEYLAKQIYNSSKIIKYMRDQFTDLELLNRIFVDHAGEVDEYFIAMKKQYALLTPYTTSIGVDKLVLDGKDFRTSAAQFKYLYDKLNAIDSFDMADLFPKYKENFVLSKFEFAESILNKPVGAHNFGSYDKYFYLNTIDEDIAGVKNFVDTTKKIDSIESMFEQMDDADITNARVFEKYGAVRDILKTIEEVNEMVDSVFKANGQDMSSIAQIIERIKDFQNNTVVKQIDNLQKLSSEDLYKYLWNNSKGIVVIDLETASRSDLLKGGMLTDPEKYTRKGMDYYVDDDRLIFYLTRDFDDFKIDDVRVKLPEVEGVDDHNSEIIRKYIGARKKVITQIPDATGTNVEIMGKSKYYNMLEKLPEKVRENLVKYDVLNQHHKFDGMNFNESIFSDLAHKRDYVDYVYNNPLKNLYYTMQEYAKINDAQAHYAKSLRSNEFNLGSDFMKRFNNEEIYKTLQDNPHLKIGAIIKDKKRGFMFKELRVHSAKDIQKMRGLQASILPHHLLKKSISMINNDGITNPLVRFFNKYGVGLSKTGMLSSVGFLLRNLFDSHQKNIFTLGIKDSTTRTFKTAKLYNEYNTVAQQVLEQYGRMNSRTINEFFSKYDGMDKEMFELMRKFIQDGPSAGLSGVMQQKIGNVYYRLYQRSEYKDMLSWQDIRKFILDPNMQDPKKWAPEVYPELVRLNSEFDVYHKAYVMMEHTKHSELKLDKLVYYLKHEDQVPEKLAKEFKRIKKFKPTSRAQQQLDKVLFENIWSRSIMSANSHMEQIFRLSDYLGEVIDKGTDVSKAMYEVALTHFDTAHKTYNQELLEMMFPFSMFRLNNIRFWGDMLEKNPRGIALISDIVKQNMNLDEYSDWDLANRRSLQYQVLNGAVILDKESGLNLKLSPSVLDAYTALYNPMGVVTGGLVVYAKNPTELALMEKEEWMDEEYFEKIKQNKYWGMVPLVGTNVIRQTSAIKHQDRTGSSLPRYAPSVFGSTNMPKENNFVTPKPYDYKMYPKYNRYFGKNFSYYNLNRAYNSEAYAPKPNAYNNARFSDMRTLNYSPLLSRHINKTFQNREDLFTARGKHKLDLMMIPPSPGSAKFTLSNIWR